MIRTDTARLSDIAIPAESLAAAMRQAIAAALLAQRPFGAALLEVSTLSTVSCANTAREDRNRFAHAEMNILRAGLCDSQDQDLANYVLVSTAEPCPMCAAASVFSGVRAIVFGTSIETLAENGWFQILIRACDVVASSTHANRPLVLGGFLSRETDLLYPDLHPGLHATTSEK